MCYIFKVYLHDGRNNGHDNRDGDVELTAMVGQRLRVVPCVTTLALKLFKTTA